MLIVCGIQFMAGCDAGSALAVACISLEGGEAVGPTHITAAAEKETESDNDEDEHDEVAPLPKRGSAVKRVSIRDFYNDVCLSQINFDALAAKTSSWEMVLANGTREDIEMMDVLFVGHEDG